MVQPSDNAWKSLVDEPDIAHITIDDDTPARSIYAEKQERLLTEPLYTTWSGLPPHEAGDAKRSFIVTANVGLFGSLREPALVPDILFSADVAVHPDFHRDKQHGTYFIWEMGKPPDVVIEVVSNREGDEFGKRMSGHLRWAVSHYIVWDPMRHLGGPELRAFRNEGASYLPMQPVRFPSLGLGLVAWEGTFEGVTGRWLRWIDANLQLIPTGAEALVAERQRADVERQRADRLAEKLRELGVADD